MYYDLKQILNNYLIISIQNDVVIGDVLSSDKSVIEIKILAKLLTEKLSVVINSKKITKDNISNKYKLSYYQSEFFKKNELKINNFLESYFIGYDDM